MNCIFTRVADGYGYGYGKTGKTGIFRAENGYGKTGTGKNFDRDGYGKTGTGKNFERDGYGKTGTGKNLERDGYGKTGTGIVCDGKTGTGIFSPFFGREFFTKYAYMYFVSQKSANNWP